MAMSDCWEAAATEMSEGDRKKHWSPIATPRRNNAPPRFDVGQLVWVRKPFQSPGESKATRQQWYGPYKVLQRISDLVYLIERESYDDEIHVDRLKRYRTYEQDGPRERYREHARLEEEKVTLERVRQRELVEAQGENSELSEEHLVVNDEEVVVHPVLEGAGAEDEVRLVESAELSSEEVQEEELLRQVQEDEMAQNEFEVESILDRRVLRSSARLDKGERIEYLVKWKYWPDTDNTWERVENLGNCMDRVREFELMSNTR